jgi:hypothetical protein
MMNCPLCAEPITAAEDRRPLAAGFAHRECLLRSAVGGIGHLEDHNLWCVLRGDPDGGRSYRESARAVDAWIHAHGLPAR